MPWRRDRRLTGGRRHRTEVHGWQRDSVAFTPGVYFGDVAEARRWVRDVNEFAAEVVLDRPDRFGSFATPTLPGVDGALAEAEYALDALHADGIVLPANNDGSYPGDSGFDRGSSENLFPRLKADCAHRILGRHARLIAGFEGSRRRRSAPRNRPVRQGYRPARPAPTSQDEPLSCRIGFPVPAAALGVPAARPGRQPVLAEVEVEIIELVDVASGPAGGR